MNLSLQLRSILPARLRSWRWPLVRRSTMRLLLDEEQRRGLRNLHDTVERAEAHLVLKYEQQLAEVQGKARDQAERLDALLAEQRGAIRRGVEGLEDVRQIMRAEHLGLEKRLADLGRETFLQLGRLEELVGDTLGQASAVNARLFERERERNRRHRTTTKKKGPRKQTR